MSDFKVSSLQGNQQKLAQKCDINNDGVLDDKEYSVFEEGKESMTNVKPGFFNFWGKEKTEVTIGGVKFDLAEVEKFKKNSKKSKYDNQVEFKNGLVIDYDVQAKGNKASANSDTPSKRGQTLTFVKGFCSGDGVRVSGTDYHEDIVVSDSVLGGVIAYGGDDSVATTNCRGYDGGSMVSAEDYTDIASEDIYHREE